MEIYAPGSHRISIKFRVRNANQSVGALTNPSVVTFTYADPNGVEVEKVYPDTIVRAATGIYYLDFTAEVPGTWRYRMDGDGSAVEGQFGISPSVFV
jgi:hypothetical protein